MTIKLKTISQACAAATLLAVASGCSIKHPEYGTVQTVPTSIAVEYSKMPGARSIKFNGRVGDAPGAAIPPAAAEAKAQGATIGKASAEQEEHAEKADIKAKLPANKGDDSTSVELYADVAPDTEGKLKPRFGFRVTVGDLSTLIDRLFGARQ